MNAGGINPAGSGRALRLDPFSLPVRYKANDGGADGRERIVELHSDRVVLRREVCGIPMRVCAPVTSYRGVAMRIVPPAGDFDGAVALTLEHSDPGLTVPLFVASDGSEMAVEWQVWARVLGLPRLVQDADGALRDPFAGMASVKIGEGVPRRRGHATLAVRRGRKRFRRKAGLAVERPVYRGEREIIARN